MDRQVRKAADENTTAVCLNVSIYDIQWGTIAVLPSGLLFTVTSKPASLQGMLIQCHSPY